MSSSIRLFDTVALADDLPEHGLARGRVGAVIEVLEPGVLEVEFADHEGRTCAELALREEQLIVLHPAPEHVA